MKQASRLLSLLALTVALVVLTGIACQKSTPERVWAPGAFEPMSENIETYSPPGGVTIDSVIGYDGDTDTLESDIPLYAFVSNSNSGNTSVTFPAGLVFGPLDPEYEYMMLLKDFTFTAAGGGSSTAILPTYGCNEDSLYEPDPEISYTQQGKEWDKETQKLLDVMAGKTIPDSLKDLVQEALDEVTQGDSLTDSTKTKLSNLP